MEVVCSFKKISWIAHSLAADYLPSEEIPKLPHPATEAVISANEGRRGNHVRLDHIRTEIAALNALSHAPSFEAAVIKWFLR